MSKERSLNELNRTVIRYKSNIQFPKLVHSIPPSAAFSDNSALQALKANLTSTESTLSYLYALLHS